MEEQLSTASRTEKKKNTKQQKKPKRAWKIIKILLLVFLAVFIIGGGAAAGYVATLLKRTPTLDLNAITNMAATTKVYDSDKQLMFTLQGDGDRDVIKSLDQVSPFVVHAFIAAEDKNFYSHHGINPMAMARAAVQDVLGHGIVSGASTITQQTIKNAVFPEQDRTLERKVQEAYLAIQLEKKLTKDEILTTYLNWIYFGQSGPNNLYGIESASKAIFGIPAKNLNLAQATLLASLPNNPSIYNPYDHLDATLQRQDYILNEMLKEGYITKQQLDDAKKYDAGIGKEINAQKAKSEVHAGEFGHLNPEIEAEAAQKLYETGKFDSLNDAKQTLYRGGYSIYTTINRKMQTAVDQTINDSKFYPPNINYSITDISGKTIQVKNALEQAGATLIDNKTGKILAVGGGRDYQHDQVNHATQPRQPGSTMKPIGVYGPAIDLKQIGSGSVVDDVPMVWSDSSAPNGKYFPMNWDNRFHGLMTVRTALEQSYNIPALKVFHQITPKVGLDYVKRMGVTTLTDSDNNLAAGIGGLSQGLTVEEATSAYSTFPDAGTHHDAYMIEDIKDRNGVTVYQHQAKTDQIFNPNTAYIMNDMLKGVVKRGTATIVGNRFPNAPIAGKTGTTNDDKDAWFIGYTPDVTLGIWVGYNIPKTLDASQTHLPLNLWNAIMSQVMPNIQNPSKDFFPNPGGVRQVAVCKYSGKLPTDLCRQVNGVTTELFLAGTEPHEPDDALIQARYYEVGGKKYLATDSTPTGMVKVGIFFKRDKFELPDNNPAYLPTDSDMQYPGDASGVTTSAIGTASPSGLKATSTGQSSISLSWSGVSGAKTYVILRADSTQGPYQVQNQVSGTTYNDTNVQTGHTYSYKVISTDSNGVQSDPSTAVTVTLGSSTDGDSLVPPSNVSVTPAAVGLTVTWSQVPGASGYTVYRSTDEAGGYQKIASGSDTSFTDIGALPGATFYYKVTALAGSQESAASAPNSATVPANGSSGDLSAPGSISTSNPHTGNSLVITWSAVPNATGYSVERSEDGTSWQEIGNTGRTSLTDSGLTTNRKYFYRVRALGNGNAASPASIAAIGTPTR